MRLLIVLMCLQLRGLAQFPSFPPAFPSTPVYNSNPTMYNHNPGFYTLNSKVVKRQAVLTGGNIDTLNTVKHINIQYDYQHMSVNKFQNEEQYFAYILKKKGEVKGQKFIEHWKQLPKTCLEPEFEKKFGERMTALGITIKNDTDTSGVTLLVHVTKVKLEHTSEGDANVPPYLTLSCTFFDPGSFLVSFSVDAYGSHEPNVESVLRECYQIAGDVLGKKIYYHLTDLREAQQK